jgi:hypothetical protein
MPVTYAIAGGVLHLMLDGEYTPGDVTATFLAGLNDPRCPRPVRLLMDVTHSCVLATRPAEDIQRVAEFLGPYAERIGGRVAVIAPTDVKLGLSQMGAVHSSRVGVETRVFRTGDAARAWLDGSAASA